LLPHPLYFFKYCVRLDYKSVVVSHEGGSQEETSKEQKCLLIFYKSGVS